MPAFCNWIAAPMPANPAPMMTIGKSVAVEWAGCCALPCKGINELSILAGRGRGVADRGNGGRQHLHGEGCGEGTALPLEGCPGFVRAGDGKAAGDGDVRSSGIG